MLELCGRRSLRGGTRSSPALLPARPVAGALAPEGVAPFCACCGANKYPLLALEPRRRTHPLLSRFAGLA